ncbi:N-acetyltransferase [Nereida sp. MMG025]|uniref:GNAT family N-acetyltransferase n=1 Tax=Nereida sp. MMG025 TaxID=2909981 RepID=UPI001F2C4BEC|nr:GNAT family N-acetyltransferase [Nereida sp. MMG025]MCF6443458.1 GNAT family N-acetyltransferase [Nereida sp. MMG025]
MSASLHLAGPDALARLATMIDAAGSPLDFAQIEGALAPILNGTPHGAAYLIGPARAPVGFVLVSFGWCVNAGGMTATIDQIFIRENIRGRGMGSEVLIALPKALAAAGVMTMRAHIPSDNTRAKSLFARLRFIETDAQTMQLALT